MYMFLQTSHCAHYRWMSLADCQVRTRTWSWTGSSMSSTSSNTPTCFYFFMDATILLIIKDCFITFKKVRFASNCSWWQQEIASLTQEAFHSPFVNKSKLFLDALKYTHLSLILAFSSRIKLTSFPFQCQAIRVSFAFYMVFLKPDINTNT